MTEMIDKAELAKMAKIAAFWERAAPLKPFLEDSDVTEIMVNRVGELVIERANGDQVAVACPEITLDFLQGLGDRLANLASGNKSFDEQHPELTSKLPTGERVSMTHPPMCPDDVRYMNIRKHTGVAFTHQHLIDSGYYAHTRHEYSLSLSDEDRARIAEHLPEEELELWALARAGKISEFVEKSVKYYQNIVISGATGSGKTSYMRALIEMINPADRIITVEDTPEMPLPNHRNNNSLFYKKNEKDDGALPEDVLHACMRKTPKRVLLAELRGNETMSYLSGVLSSGHPGGITTTHAGSPKAAKLRLALLILQSKAGQALTFDTVMMLLHMSVDVVIQLNRSREKGRHVPAIYYDPMYRLSLLD
jgi:type IV secretion system protein VirB11